jgi:CubicO group peptidase (beta-lactamase class C family)
MRQTIQRQCSLNVRKRQNGRGGETMIKIENLSKARVKRSSAAGAMAVVVWLCALPLVAGNGKRANVSGAGADTSTVNARASVSADAVVPQATPATKQQPGEAFATPNGNGSDALAANASDQQKESSSGAVQVARIARIENGLLPAVVIKGRPMPKLTLAAEMKRYKVYGVSVAFFEHGRILWTRTYGLADLAHKTPVTRETLFQAASISKPETAMAALHLVEEGKLNLDENVNDVLRSWKVPDNEFTKEQKVTLRRLLSHSAGLTIHGFPGYARREAVPTLVEVLNGTKPANTAAVRVDTVPGTIWRYSGGGFEVTQLLLTDVTGETFPTLMHDIVLEPAGMTHSTYEQPLPQKLWPLAAVPYRSSGEPVAGGWHTYPEMAAAGLWTTPSDLAHLAIEVQREYAGESSKILSQKMAHEMLTVQKADWGLGFEVTSTNGALRFGHGGSNEGYMCDLQAYVGLDGEGIAIMTNSDNGGLLMAEMLRAVGKEYNWPDFRTTERAVAKVGAATLAKYAGTYEQPVIGKLVITLKNGRLHLQSDAMRLNEALFPQSEAEFFMTSQDLTFEFHKDAKGAVTEVVLHAGPQSFTAKKMP